MGLRGGLRSGDRLFGALELEIWGGRIAVLIVENWGMGRNLAIPILVL